jgi:hypothetical protein
MPMKFIISSAYGAVEQIRDNVPHNGIDVPLEVGTKLRSIIDGTVEQIINNSKIGHGVIIRGTNGDLYTYGHLSKITCKVGQHVHAGQEIIGLSGSTGNSTGPHLHFSVQHAGSYIDPTPLLNKLEAVTGADPLGRYVGEQPLPGSFMDWLNHGADKIMGKEKEVTEVVSHPVLSFIGHQLADFGHWLVSNMPEIMGYGTVLAGACIVLGSMIGKGGMMKPLVVYAMALIVAFITLSNK